MDLDCQPVALAVITDRKEAGAVRYFGVADQTLHAAVRDRLADDNDVKRLSLLPHRT